FRVGKAEQTSAATSATDFRRACACRLGGRDEIVDYRSSDAGGHLNGRPPLGREVLSNSGPVLSDERGAKCGCGGDDLLEAVEYMTIAIDVALGDFPIFSAGKMRSAVIDEHEPTLECSEIDVDGNALDPIRPEFECG